MLSQLCLVVLSSPDLGLVHTRRRGRGVQARQISAPRLSDGPPDLETSERLDHSHSSGANGPTFVLNYDDGTYGRIALGVVKWLQTGGTLAAAEVFYLDGNSHLVRVADGTIGENYRVKPVKPWPCVDPLRVCRPPSLTTQPSRPRRRPQAPGPSSKRRPTSPARSSPSHAPPTRQWRSPAPLAPKRCCTIAAGIQS